MGTTRINDGEIMVWRRIFAGRAEEVGRSGAEPGTLLLLIEATDRFKT
jgi:hypothetical protein